MQFERAESVTPSAPPVCARCRGILSGTYFAAGKFTLCATCGEGLKRVAGSFEGMRFLTSLAAGVAVILIAGVGSWIAASRFTQPIGYLALFAGLMIGYPVRWGSGGRGGRPYQVLAVLLTYVATAAFFVPQLLRGEQSLTPGRLVMPLWVIVAAPFLGGLRGLVVWLVVGLNCFQAWRMNRSVAVDIKGPFPLGQAIPPGGAGGV